MKSRKTQFKLSSLVAALLIGIAAHSTAFAFDDDAGKLEALKRAMSEPGEGAVKKKTRTRAIVFDNDGGQAEAPAAAAAGPMDCGRVSPDAQATAVDFAIQFKVGSSEISAASMATLNEIGKILALSPNRCVLVEGHTDASGNADKNMDLSRDRANSVVRYISEKGGVERKRLVPIGKGSTSTIPNLDPRDAKNRRVVFKVVAG